MVVFLIRSTNHNRRIELKPLPEATERHTGIGGRRSGFRLAYPGLIFFHFATCAGSGKLRRRSTEVNAIVPEARFEFVSVKDYTAKPGEIRFDMFKGEFTHIGDKCSFEVLLDRIGLDDPALRAISEIVHDIDLKDGKFGREQAAGIAHVIAGICASQKEDLAMTPPP
jgi:Chromate resistance exported protein